VHTQEKAAEMLMEVSHFHLILMSVLASIGGPFFLMDGVVNIFARVSFYPLSYQFLCPVKI
jgi:hypothetical protein